MGAPQGNSFLSIVGWLVVILSACVWPSWWVNLTTTHVSDWHYREIAPTIILGLALATSSSALKAHTASQLLRGYLVVMAIVELPEIYNFLVVGASLSPTYFSTLADADPERRLWSFLLVLLVLSRLLAAAQPESRAVRLHCAAVHVAELAALGGEKLRHGSNGDDGVILALIISNAVLLSGWAMAPIKVKAA